MPLISSTASPGARTNVQIHDQETVKEQRDCQFQNFNELDDEFMDSEIENSILSQGRPGKVFKLKAPALPQRSDKRASRILDNTMLELQTLDGSTPKEEQQVETADPHELYLSSEEDASFSDYDDADSLMDFEPSPIDEDAEHNAPSSRASSRRSQEDTARVVSFVTAGKPQIIDIYIHSNSGSPQKQPPTTSITNSQTSLPEARRPPPIRLFPSALHRLSISSVSSVMGHESINRSSTMPMPYESTASLVSLPSHKSSRMASIVTSTKHAFLSSDPYPTHEVHSTSSTESTPITPKTPISMAAAAWKTGFSRKISLGRKQSSPKLSLAYAAGAVSSQNQTKAELVLEEVDREIDQWKQRQRAATTPPAEVGSIIKASLQKETKERAYSLGMRGLTRRKSVRGRERFLG
jgi:hypothetical protein